MQIEQGFRDWKTHLGVRGLKLESNPAVRMGRLLLAFALAYICLLLLGAHDQVHRQTTLAKAIQAFAGMGKLTSRPRSP